MARRRANRRSRYGEIDLIAENAREFVFIEVKTRRSLAFGEPLHAVTSLKLARLVAQADVYLARRNMPADWTVALDVIGLVVRGGLVTSIDHARVYP